MTTESTPTETFESKVSSTIDEAAGEGERMLARAWRMIAANGIAAVLFGFVLVLWPDIGLTTIVAVVAVYALVRAVLSGLAAFAAPLPRSERGWLLLEAVVGTAIGIALLVWNDISAQTLLYVVAAWALTGGVPAAVWVGAAASFAHTSLVTVVARVENARGNPFPFPAVPAFIAAMGITDGLVLALLRDPSWILAGMAAAAFTWAGQRYVRGD